MSWRLREDLYWCECGGRVVFLDLKSDRYFCLPQQANGAFLRAVRNEPEPHDRERLEPLVRRELLANGDGRTAMRSPAAVEVPESDFPTNPAVRTGLLNILRAISSELLITWLLRRRPLHKVIESIRRIRPTVSLVERDEHRSIEAAVSAAAATTLFLRSHDRCLVRALALHSSCRKRGLHTKLVFGVIAHPFAAHCWVQLGNAILVGGYEQARLYTPILVLE